MNKLKYIIVCFGLLWSCSKDQDDEAQTLYHYTQGRSVELAAVIACAASDENTGEIITFYYPELGAVNPRLYQTIGNHVDETNFANYSLNTLESAPVFNGYLGKFIQNSTQEKWMIVTFELDGDIKISNPIRSKQIAQPTVWDDAVVIDQSETGMPIFNWENNSEGNTAIYFQVVSDSKNNLLSGTYTFNNQFQYYNTSNVVLNVTTQTPPDLVINENYKFTLMDVSLDNWVNLVTQKSFIAE